LRRILLGAVTALLVARPLLPGEDPGRTSPLTTAAGPILTSLWLLALVGWAIWRAWAAQPAWRGGGVERALGVFVLLQFGSTIFAASYKHAAWLAVGEWAGVLAAFWLVRQLPRTETEDRALLTALLATAVCIAAQGLYQLARPPVLPDLDATVAAIHDLTPPAAAAGAATFAQASALAAFLALVAPALVIGLYLTARGAERLTPRLILTAAAAVVVLLALGAARCAPALLALLATVVVFLLIGRRHLATHVVRNGVLGAGAAAVVLLGLAWGEVQALAAERLAEVTPVTALVGHHFFLGVGPGNFSRHYPIYLAAPAAERLTTARGLLLETMASGGMLLLAALVVLLVALARRLLPELRLDWQLQRSEEPPDESAAPRPPRWEFMIGGMVGLALAFLLGAGTSRAAILELGLLSIARSLLWLGAFVVLEAVPWTAGWRVVALAAGILAFLLAMLAGPGFYFPSLAIPLWIMAALALNALPVTAAARPRGALGLLAPVPMLLVVWWSYFLALFLPVTSAAQSMREARSAYPVWRGAIEKSWREKLAQAPPATQAQVAGLANRFLQDRILKPLEDAVQADPNDTDLRVELAWWQGKGWALYAIVSEAGLGTEAQQARAHFTANYSNQALTVNLKQAQDQDEFGPAAFRVAYQLRRQFADLPGMKAPERQENRQMAANQMAALVRLDPSDPRRRYWLADVLRATDNPVNADLWRQEAERAAELDRQAAGSRQQLSEWQRADIKTWLRERK